jgi:hypothetical protein
MLALVVFTTEKSFQLADTDQKARQWQATSTIIITTTPEDFFLGINMSYIATTQDEIS